MNKERENLSFDSLIEQVIDAQTDDFFEIAKIYDLDPLTDFAGAELQGTNLRGKNLQGANFRNTNFSSADLSFTNLRGADLSGADLSGASLRYADIRDAYFNSAKVENARFGNNKGIYERLRLELLKGGATFEDIPLDVNEEAFQRFIQSKEKLEKYKGQHIAFTKGKFIDSDQDKKKLLERLEKQYPDQSCLIKFLPETTLPIDTPYIDIV